MTALARQRLALAPGLRLSVLFAGLAGLLLFAIVGAVGAGALAIAPGKVLAILTGNPLGLAVSPTETAVVQAIRLPRMILVGLSGAAMGVSGVLMQGLFRNPLADPGLIGVSSGAGLAAGLVIVAGGQIFGPDMPFALLPGAAFLGAMATTGLIYRLATRDGQTSISVLLLAGLAIGALAASGSGFLVFLADDKQLRDMTFWMLGSFGGTTWPKVLAAAPPLILVLAAAPWLARPLDALALGEAEAWHMGVAVERMKTICVVLAALAVGTSVAVAGMVSFVGIVVPHVARLAVGPRHRALLPAAMLMGGTLLLGADTIARTLRAPAELPLGVLTAAIGAPVFLHLLLGRRRLGSA